MKETLLSLALALAVAGCQSDSGPGGGAAPAERFTMVVPSSRVVVKQGEMQTVVVSLRRGDYFKRDVTLRVKDVAGITVEPMRAELKASDKPELQLRISAAPDAALGDFRVYLTATPSSGEPVTSEIDVRVIAP